MLRKNFSVLIFSVALAITASAIYFYIESNKTKEQAEEMNELALKSQGINTDQPKPKPKEKIRITADECKTTFGLNVLAFCDGVSLDSSLFLESGADAAVQACFEHAADKIGRPVSAARDIACEVKIAYQDRQFEFNMEQNMVGIKNNNYQILNEWVNR